MAILKIRDNEGVITNIAAIRGENGKSPIIKNGTWWTYDDELEDYIDTGLGAEKESIVTKANVEKVLTGTIDSHNHDNVYVKEAPSDSKQYVRYNGEWASIDFSSADFATKEELNTKVDKVEGKVLSTNDYTTEEKNKLSSISDGAEVNVNADWNATEGDALILNKPTIPSNVSELANDNGYITKDVSDLTNYSTTNTVNQAINNAVSSKVDASSISAVATSGDYNDLNNKPIIPSSTSELTNDSGYLVNADIANLATKDEVSTKVDKVSGKGLSTNDYTTNEKNKLAGIAAGAEVNVNADWNATSGDAMILNKPTIPSKTSQLTNDSGYITSSAVDTKISSAVASVYRVKGTVSNYSSLPTSNVTIGDVYNLSDTGANYVCTATSPITWDKLSETVDLSSYSTTAENDAKYQAKGNYITSIPTASSGTLGGIKTGYTTSTANKNYAIKLDSNSNAYVNVPWTDTNTTYSQATSSKLGLVKIGYSTSGKNYAVQLDSDGKMYANVPWTDNNTTYSAGTGISLSGTTFSNSGVRSVTAGSSSNQLSVNTGGTTSTITINNVANAANATNATNAANATSASKLSTARNINIAGSVTGTALFDGSNNITINTTTNHIHKDSIKVADIDLNSLLIWATLGVAADNFETTILANVNEGETGYFISRDASKTAVIKVTENSIEIEIQRQSASVSKTTVFTYNRADGTKTTSHDGLTFTLNGNGTKYLSNNGKYSDPCPSIKEMSDELYEAVNKLDSDVESTKSEGITYLSNNISENTKTYYFKNKITSADNKLFVSSYCIIIRNTSYNSSNVKDSDVIYVSYSGLYSWSNPNTYPIYRYSLIVDLINNTVVTNGGGIITSENGNVTVLGVSGDKDYSYRLISDATIFKSMFNQFNSVNTLASLPVDKYGIQAKVTSATTLSFAGTPSNGMEYMIDILNNSSSDIVQTLPNTGSYQSNAESITLPKGKVTSISVRYVFSKFIIRV